MNKCVPTNKTCVNNSLNPSLCVLYMSLLDPVTNTLFKEVDSQVNNLHGTLTTNQT